MSNNNWETQPRKENGEFTYRYEFWKKKLRALEEAEKSHDVNNQFDGGSYYELRKKYAGNSKVEIHHMPAAGASQLPYRKGPCIAMEKKDHMNTSSYKSFSVARRYREVQLRLINSGRFLEAEIMDFNDIISKTKSKYVKTMLEKLEYDKKLYIKGEING